MRDLLWAVTAASLAGCAASPTGVGWQNPAIINSALSSPSGRYLVSFRAETSMSSRSSLLSRSGAEVVDQISDLAVTVVRSSQDLAGLSPDAVEYVEPDLVRTFVAPRDSHGQALQARPRAQQTSGAEMLPANDVPFVTQQWGLGSIGAAKAWSRTMGDPSVVVAVIDTGVDLSHPALRDRLVPGMSFVNLVSDSSNSGTGGALVPFRNVGPIDDNGHGTHVAGIIAASRDGAQGVSGVAPGCRIMPVKVLAFNSKGLDSDVAQGITWAVDHGARILNLSLGAEGGSKTLERAVAYATAHGALVCAAMGNDGDDPTRDYGSRMNYPAAFPGVLAVGALAPSRRPASFSNHGRWIGVSAPGSNILSTTPTYSVYEELSLNYDQLSGTSQATPFVSGTAALALSAHPQLSGSALRQWLCQSARDVLFPGFDLATGYGEVDAAAAVL